MAFQLEAPANERQNSIDCAGHCVTQLERPLGIGLENQRLIWALRNETCITHLHIPIPTVRMSMHTGCRSLFLASRLIIIFCLPIASEIHFDYWYMSPPPLRNHRDSLGECQL